jgi:nucleoside-diphosphate-sugar epimerase
VARAFHAAVTGTARGAFNLAAAPVVDASLLAGLLGARVVRAPARLVRGAVAAGWWLHLVPATPGLLDAVLHLPLMDSSRAAAELGWAPRRSSTDALGEFLAGLRAGAGGPTPPLDPDAGGPLRAGEVATGVGGRDS